MPIHPVAPGECLASIAYAYGFSRPQDIYEAPENDALRKARPDPNVLFPGDEVFIPEMKKKEVACQTGKSHVLRITLPKRQLRVVLKDGAGEPLAGKPYKLTGQGISIEGTLDDKGTLDEMLPARIQELDLEINGSKRHILLGHLNPLRDTSDSGSTGVQARLRNLGFDVGPIDGDVGPRTRAALREFQEQAGLEPTGEINEDTLKALESAHGS